MSTCLEVGANLKRNVNNIPLNRSTDSCVYSSSFGSNTFDDFVVSPVLGSGNSAANTLSDDVANLKQNSSSSNTLDSFVVSPASGSASMATNTFSEDTAWDFVAPLGIACEGVDTSGRDLSFVLPACGLDVSAKGDCRRSDFDARLGTLLQAESFDSSLTNSSRKSSCDYNFVLSDAPKLSFMTDAMRRDDPFADTLKLDSDVRAALDWVACRSDENVMLERERIISEIERTCVQCVVCISPCCQSPGCFLFVCTNVHVHLDVRLC